MDTIQDDKLTRPVTIVVFHQVKPPNAVQSYWRCCKFLTFIVSADIMT